MQKITVTSGDSFPQSFIVSVTPGRKIYLLTKGSISATIKYSSSPGVYEDFATPLVLASQQEVVNYGAHSQMAIVITSVTGTATIIANPEALQERGR
jgi:hypothetical protein